MPKRAKFSKKDPRVRLAHILESIEAIEGYLAGMDFGVFVADVRTRDAVARRVEIIGEAVKALGALAPELLARHSDVPWSDIKGMREKLAHDYDTISVRILWTTATRELPGLRNTIARMIAEMTDSKSEAEG